MALVFFGLLLPAVRVSAYSPESPEVKALLGPAIDYLSKTASQSNRLGGSALIGLALLKGDQPKDHPKVQEAVVRCQQAVDNIRTKHSSDIIYDLGIAIIFLCELDAEQYRSEIQALMNVLIGWQKEFGGWGYLEGPNVPSGDTSMTQYAVLSLWTADRTGAVPVSAESATKVCNWLLRTQDVSGGWGYQGKDPGKFERVPQFDVQHSLSAAGCGSVYICADLLRLVRAAAPDRPDGLPSAVRLVREEGRTPSQGPLTDQVPTDYLRRSLSGGDQWFAQNFRIDPPAWTHYYMYALERYQSFRELTVGSDIKDLAWYDKGVDLLKSTQKSDGSWDGDGGPAVDTCFAILFLTRGTKKSIEKAEAFNGRLRGGRGLPTTTADVVVGEDGQIVKTPFQGKAESLLAILEASGEDDFDFSAQGIEITLSVEPDQRERELDRLRRLVASDEFPVRMAALQALYGTRDLDNVPTLIYALGDPDSRIVRKARDGLRLMSRKIDGFGLSDDPSDGAKLDAINRWKDWYLSIRPDAQFLN